MLVEGTVFWAELGTPKEWMTNMGRDKVWIDHCFLQIAANYFNKSIVIIL